MATEPFSPLEHQAVRFGKLPGRLSHVLNRPVATTYLGHLSAHRVDPVDGGSPYDVFTHFVVIQVTCPHERVYLLS